MAKTLDDYPFRDPSPPSSVRYPWDEWTNGRVWELRRGVDFDIEPRDMAREFRRAAVSRGKRARTARVAAEGLVVVQAIPGLHSRPQ
jgi:hypothetical protein